MKTVSLFKRFTAAALSLLLLLSLALVGVPAALAADEGPSDALKAIYEALLDPESDYSSAKALYEEYYPEVAYTEALEDDRIVIRFAANGNEYLEDGTWEFVEEDGYLRCELDSENLAGLGMLLYVASAVAESLGMDGDLAIGYLNGLGALELESEYFSMTEDEDAGTTTCRLKISEPWEMPELDQMVISADVMGDEPLGPDFSSQGGSIGRIRMLANGSVDSFTMLFAEIGELDEIAYQSIVNMVTARKPTGWEAFLADFTALEDLETEDYCVVIDPDEETIWGLMGEPEEKLRYVLVRFGDEQGEEYEYETYVPSAETFADAYFRAVGSYHMGTAGSSLAQAQIACDVLSFAKWSELWLVDTEELRDNLLAAWESLSDSERADFDENFPALNELLYACLADWDANRAVFEDAGVAEAMEDVLADLTAEWSWDTLSANTWTLGNSED